MTEGRIYGRNPVLELLRADGRRADEIAVLAGAHGPLAEIVALARRAGVKVSYRTREQLTAIAGSDRHQGVVARVASTAYVDLGALLEIPASRGEPGFFVALDQVQDSRNFGAVLRTAEVFGAHGVIVPKHHQVGLTDAAARAAMGAVEHLPVARETRAKATSTPSAPSLPRPCAPVPRPSRPQPARRPLEPQAQLARVP